MDMGEQRMGNRMIKQLFTASILASVTAVNAQTAADYLERVENSWPGANLRVSLNEGDAERVELGTSMRFNFQADSDGYLSIAYLNSEGEATIILPERRLVPGMTAAFPGPNDGIELAAELPLGQERVFAFLTEQAVTSEQMDGSADTMFFVDTAAAAKLLDILADEDAHRRVAVAELRHEIVARNGEIEFLTRDIERLLKPDPEGGGGGGTAGGNAGQGRAPRSLDAHIQFGFDSAMLTDNGKLNLDEFGKALTGGLASMSFIVAGHTDSVGPEAYNLDLSRRRAEAVVDYLVAQFGIATNRLTVQGYGETRPIDDNGTAAGRANNRRVEFTEN